MGGWNLVGIQCLVASHSDPRGGHLIKEGYADFFRGLAANARADNGDLEKVFIQDDNTALAVGHLYGCSECGKKILQHLLENRVMDKMGRRGRVSWGALSSQLRCWQQTGRRGGGGCGGMGVEVVDGVG